MHKAVIIFFLVLHCPGEFGDGEINLGGAVVVVLSSMVLEVPGQVVVVHWLVVGVEKPKTKKDGRKFCEGKLGAPPLDRILVVVVAFWFVAFLPSPFFLPPIPNHNKQSQVTSPREQTNKTNKAAIPTTQLKTTYAK